MAKIIFVTKDNDTITTEGTTGSVMELAVQNKVKGIEGNCGGVCSCATCHVHVSPEDWEKTGAPSELESDMLEFDDNVSEYSRLSCQIKVSEALDGVLLKVAQ
ncbi:2Fe-2S ferredoxin [Formosa agariphila KMM 3901]|uniref:2Fe-2S ferredoxin n=1 Tax=Formosa agariphila (strain DSM 15362 / KCTC 12365 / LMG 23005 / KMM 3901 / M-2Alg 35-1) TaxID=1347342 RepID=T2KMZ7_FORAG|nr:2Fe-2S iron-sulfur cluster-binding protein [Formosa agariphila]CDF79813.1 2Fe-2S ferredoxin [Formosa agariphila KMM 3901]